MVKVTSRIFWDSDEDAWCLEVVKTWEDRSFLINRSWSPDKKSLEERGGVESFQGEGFL